MSKTVSPIPLAFRILVAAIGVAVIPTGGWAQQIQLNNTSGPDDRCPADKWAALDQQELAEELGTKFLYLNPTPLTARRHWVMDELRLYKAGESVDFHGAKGTRCASMSPEEVKQMGAKDYEAGEIHRVTKYLYKKGSQVFLMHDSSGKTWVTRPTRRKSTRI